HKVIRLNTQKMVESLIAFNEVEVMPIVQKEHPHGRVEPRELALSQVVRDEQHVPNFGPEFILRLNDEREWLLVDKVRIGLADLKLHGGKEGSLFRIVGEDQENGDWQVHPIIDRRRLDDECGVLRLLPPLYVLFTLQLNRAQVPLDIAIGLNQFNVRVDAII